MLSNEKAMCASSPSSPLQVSYSSQVTQAKVLRHAVLHRTGQVCFSKEMLPECDIGFIASETMVQEAGFVCLPAAAAEAKDILRRIHLGQDCNELNSMTVTFELMESVKSQHSTLDATQAVRPVVQGAGANTSPAGKIRAMFTPPEDPERVPQNILFVEDLTDRVSLEFPELWKLGQAYFKGELHVEPDVGKQPVFREMA